MRYSLLELDNSQDPENFIKCNQNIMQLLNVLDQQSDPINFDSFFKKQIEYFRTSQQQ